MTKLEWSGSCLWFGFYLFLIHFGSESLSLQHARRAAASIILTSSTQICHTRNNYRLIFQAVNDNNMTREASSPDTFSEFTRGNRITDGVWMCVRLCVMGVGRCVGFWKASCEHRGRRQRLKQLLLGNEIRWYGLLFLVFKLWKISFVPQRPPLCHSLAHQVRNQVSSLKNDNRTQVSL